MIINANVKLNAKIHVIESTLIYAFVTFILKYLQYRKLWAQNFFFQMLKLTC